MWKLLASLFNRGRMALARRRQTLARWHRSRAGQLIGAFLAAQAAAHAQVVPDGQTATTVRNQGATTQVTTGTVSGRTGFNSFAQFSVAGPQTVNLILPGQTQNLINIVRDERSVIDGTVNSVRDGAIGGNVFFLNPHGFMVGAGGRFNVGSLSLQTPTVAFVSGFFANGAPDAARTRQVLDGSAPVNPDAAIDLRGTVNAIGDVSLSAGTLTVGGRVYSGARFVHGTPDFSDVVNARGLASSTGVEQRGGRIFLTAAGDLAVSGTLSSPGTAGEPAGSIELHAGRDLDMRAGATLDVSADAGGQGGRIVVGARGALTLSGGQFTAAQGTGPATLAAARVIDGPELPVPPSPDVTLTSDTGITVSPDAIITSRKVDAGASLEDNASGKARSIGDSGAILLQAPTIDVGAGARLVSLATDGYHAGPITLEATGATLVAPSTAVTIGAATLDARALPAADGTGGPVGNAGTVTIKALSDPGGSLLGYRAGTATVTLNGTTVQGGAIDVSAKTVLKNRWPDTPEDLAKLDDVLDDPGAALLDEATKRGYDFLTGLVGASIVHSQVDARSTVTIGANSVLDASSGTASTHKLTLRAENETEASGKGAKDAGGLPIGIGAMYVNNKSVATVEVTNATLTATDLEVRAHNDATVEGEVTASKSGVGSFAVGITRADIQATASVGSAAVLHVSGDVSVAATGSHKFTNETKAETPEAEKEAGVAAAVAISDLHASTRATLNADVSGAASVSVVSVNHTTENTTQAEAKVGQEAEIPKPVKIAGQDIDGAAFDDGDGSGLLAKVGEKTPASTEKIKPTKPFPFRLGGAVAFSDSTMSSTAEVGAQVTAGDRIVVAARTIGEETGTQAQAEAATKADDKSTGSRWVVGAGVAIGLYEHNADARVAEGATLKAPQIGIHADVSLPRKPTPPEKLIKNWDSWEEVYGKVDTLKDLIDPGAYFNGATSAETDGTEVSLAGGFDLQRYTGNARATVERSASLVLKPAPVPAPASAGAWSHSYVFGPADTDTEEFKFAHRIQVQAQQAAELWFLAGKLGNVSAGNVAAGGSYNQIISKGDTLALLHEGVQVRGEDAAGNTVAAGDVGVSAITTDRLVAVTVGAGKGESFGLTGSFSVTSVNRSTLAAIDDEAKVHARQVRVDALQDMSSWAIAGAVGRAQSAAVGLGAAVNDGTAEVTARIGDIDSRAIGGSQLALADGSVTTAELGVTSHAQGRLQAVALAGAVAGASDNADSGFFDGLKKKVEDLLGKGEDVSSAEPEGNATKKAKSDKEPTKYNFTLAGAGSAAVNLTSVHAQAELDHAKVMQTGQDQATLAVRAINTTDIVSASGAGALTTGQRTEAAPSVGIAGAVAVNVLSGGAQARVVQSTVTGADSVAVQALKGGDVLSMGVALDVNTAPQQQTGIQLTGSVSVTLSNTETGAEGRRDEVVAAVDGSTVSFDKADIGRALEVSAYNKARLGTGAGSLNFGGAMSVGAAVTYSDLRNTTEARIAADAGRASRIEDAATVDLNAYNAMQIAAGAAMASVSTKGSPLGTFAFSGSVVVNQATNITSAALSDSQVVSTGAQAVTRRVSVTATDVDRVDRLDARMVETDPLDPTAAPTTGDNIHQYNGSDLRGALDNPTESRATLTTADKGNSIVAVAGNVSAGRGTQAGFAVDVNLLGNTVSATVDRSTVALADVGAGAGAGTGLQVQAASRSNILGVAFGVAVGDKSSLGGSVGVNEIDNVVTARVQDLNTGDANAAMPRLLVSALDDSHIATLSGQVSASVSGGAAGAAVNYNAIDNQVDAQLIGTQVRANRDTTVAAGSQALIQNISVAGAAAPNAGLAGSVALNFIDNRTSATTRDTTVGQVGADAVADLPGQPKTSPVFAVQADDQARIASIAGALAGGGSAGVGLAFSLNDIGSTDADAPGHATRAAVSDSTVRGGEAVTVQATSTTTIDALGAAVAAAGGNSLSGSFAINQIAARTGASVSGGLLDGEFAQAKLGASDQGSIHSLAGGAAFGGSAGVGAALALNRIDNQVDAALTGNTAQAHALRSLEVVAKGDQAIESLTVAAGAAGSAGVGASVAVNLIGNQVSARIDGGADVVAQEHVAVVADSDERIANAAGSVGVGGSVGIGASVSTNMIEGSTVAEIDGAGTHVSALGKGTAGAQVASGALEPDTLTSGDFAQRRAAAIAHDFSTIDLKGRQLTETVHGVAVNASATHLIHAVSVNAGGGTVGVGGVVNVNVVGGDTQARIADATINDATGAVAAQQVSVKASDHAEAHGFLGNLAGGGLGVGLTANVDTFSRTTTAEVNAAALHAAGQAQVQARSSQTSSGFVAGAAAGAVAGLAGTAGVTRFESRTEATLSGETIEVGSLDVSADHTSRVLQTSAGLAVSGGAATGIGASVVLDASQTSAALSGAKVDTAGTVNVAASTHTQVDVLALAASAGSVGFAGNAAVVVTHNSTEATVDGGRIGAADAKAGAITVQALDELTIDAKGGSVGLGGGLGLAGGASLVKAENRTAALVRDATLTSQGSVTVAADTRRNLGSTAVALAAGGVGLAGNTAVVLSGTNDADATRELDSSGGTLSEIDRVTLTSRRDGSAADDPTVSSRDGAVNLNADDVSRINAGFGSGVRGDATTVHTTETSARITGSATNVSAAGVQVRADELNRSQATTGAGAFGGVGFGLAVSISEIKSHVDARIDDQAKVSAGRDGLTLQATAGDLGDGVAAGARSYQGAGGVVGAGAAIARATNRSTVTAQVAGGAQVSTEADAPAADGTLRVQAIDTSGADAQGMGFAAGLVGGGIVSGRALNAGQTEASITGAGTLARIDSGTLDVVASRAGHASAAAEASAGGVLSGAGAWATAVDEGQASAGIVAQAAVAGARGDNADAVGGTVNVAAESRPQTEAQARGVSVSAGGGVGASEALAQSSGKAVADVTDASVTARDLTVSAGVLDGAAPTASATSFAGAGGLLVGVQATSAEAQAQGQALATLDRSTLDLGRKLTLESTANSSGHTLASGISVGGLVGAGASDALTNSHQVSKALLGSTVTGTVGGTAHVGAYGSDALEAVAESGSGGVVSGTAADATNTNTSITEASVALKSPLTLDRIEVQARHVGQVDGAVSTMAAGVVGGSGGLLSSTVDTRTLAGFADDAVVNAREIDVSAEGVAKKPDRAGFNVQAGAGGAVGASAAQSSTLLKLDTQAVIGQRAQLTGTGTLGNPGDFRFGAHNEVQAQDDVNLDAGGAIAVANAVSSLTALTNAAVVVGEQADVRATGDLALGAWTRGNVATQAHAKTYGLAGAPIGTSRATIDATDQVTLNSGATLRSLGDTTLAAGSGLDGQASTVDATARTDVFNKTAVPVLASMITADGTARGHSRIDVAADAQVLSVANVNLHADTVATQAAGVGTGKDLYREIAAAIANAFSWLFGGKHVSLDLHTGSASTAADATVQVDGKVIAGAQNKRLLTFAKDGTITAPEELRAQVQPRDENLFDNLMKLRGDYLAKLEFAAPGSVEQFALVAEVQRITQQLQDLGLARLGDDPQNPGQQVLVPTGNVMQAFITVPDIVARGGDIDLRAKDLRGSGELRAPNDAEIRIVNETPAFLRINALTIPDGSGGHIRLNGLDKRNNAELGPNANFSAVVTGANTEPLIHVENTWEPVNIDDRKPDLLVQGDIRNGDGTVLLKNRSGSVVVQNNPKTGQVADVVGRTVIVDAIGDVVQGYVEGFRHVGGKPEEQVVGMDGVESGAKTHDGTDNVTDAQGAIVGANVFVSGRYLNLNGLVRAGRPDWQVTLDAALDSRIAQLKADWARNGGDPRTLLTERKSLADTTIETWYNAATDRIEVQNVRVQGGRMVLSGEILNTGGGKLEALDGYGQIRITNLTSTAVEIKSLDVGTGAEGRIVLVDSARHAADFGGHGGPLVTMFERLPGGSGQTVVRSYLEIDPKTGKLVEIDGQRTDLQQDRSGTGVQYDPVSGQKYVWVHTSLTGQKRTTSSAFGPWLFWLGGISYGTPTVEELSSDTLQQLTPAEGQRGVGQDQRYTYDRQVTPDWSRESLDATGCGFLCSAFGFELRKTVTTATTVTKHTHSLMADRTIPIEFIGHDSGGISIVSTGDVVLAGGVLRNDNGTTSVTSSAGAIRGESDRGIVGGANVTLSGQTGIVGAAGTGALQVDVRGGLLQAASAAGDVRLHERGGSATYGTLSAAGTLAVASEGSIAGPDALMSGKRIELQAAGTVGTDAQPLALARGEGGVAVRAAGNVNLRHAGDLYADRVESLGGDVKLEVGGQLIDANANDLRDDRTIDQLTQMWDQVRLLEGSDAAKASEQDAIRNYRLSRERDYFEYWQARGFRAENPHVSYTPSARELATFDSLGWSAEQRNAYIADKTAAWESFRTTSYDPKYRYDVTGDPKVAQITDGVSWTEGQLKGALSQALVDKKTTDTEVRIEQPNLVGRHITIVQADGGVGRLLDSITIDTSRPIASFDPAQRAALAAAEVDDVLVDNDKRRLTVLQRDDVDLQASGTINVTTRGHAYLGGSTDLNLDAVSAGAALRIKGTGSLLSAEQPGSGLQAGGSVVLESAGGSIGRTDAALRIALTQPGVSSLTARARGDIALDASGALPVSNLFSEQGNLRLAASGAITDAQHDELTNVQAGSVDLRASAIGSADNPLELVTRQGGSIRAEARDGGAWLGDESPSANLAQLSATGPLAVTARHGIVVGSVRGQSVELSSLQGGIAADAAAQGPHGVTTLPDGSLRVSAADSIGTAETPLRTQVGRIEAVATHGSIHIDELDDLAMTAHAAQTVQLRTGGDAVLESVAADTLVLQAAGRAQVVEAQLDSGFDIGGTQVQARLRQTAGSGPAGAPFIGALGGPGGTQADRIEVSIDTAGPLQLQRLQGRTVQLGTTAQVLAVQNGWITRAELLLPQTHLVIDGLRPRPADVQLFAPTARYNFGVDGAKVVTDAFVVHKKDSHTTRSPQGRDVTVVDSAARVAVIPKLPPPVGAPGVAWPAGKGVLSIGELKFEDPSGIDEPATGGNDREGAK